MRNIWNFIMDWLYAIWISFFPPPDNDEPGDEAT